MTYINKVHCHSYVHVSTHRNVYIYSSIAFNSNSQTLLDKQRYLIQTIFFIIVETIKVLFRLAASVISVGFLLRKVDGRGGVWWKRVNYNQLKSFPASANIYMQKNKNKSFKRWEQKTQTFPRLFPDLHEMSSSSDLYRSNNKYKKYNL